LVVFCASVALAATEGDSSPWTTSKLIWRVINTIALLAVLVWALKKPLANFFSERKSKIEEDLAEARRQKEQAEQLIKEYESKIAGMEQELAKMRAELQKAGEAESQRVVANAERMALAMKESAQVTAEQEVRKARATLKNEAVTLAVELAESLIREKINEDDRKRIVEDYLAKVGGMK
jgi:F-type H+-transporting ATPase subunit b